MTRRMRERGYADGLGGKPPAKADPSYLRGHQMGAEQAADQARHLRMATCDALHVLAYDPRTDREPTTQRCGLPATHRGRVGSDPGDAPPRFPLCDDDAKRWPLAVVKIVDNSAAIGVDRPTTGA